MNIRIRGISYHFDIHQSDRDLPYLVLLHGFMGSGRQFDHLLPELKAFCNPVTIDLLGHGETEGAELHYRFSTNEQVADLVKLISEQLHIPLYLYGYSMGGRLALQVALKRPDLFRGLILESSTFGIESETERQARQSLDGRRSDQIMGNFSGFLEEWKNKPLFQPVHDEVPDHLMRSLSDIQSAQNNLWMANALQAFGTGTMPCVRKQLPGLPVPVQLIAGESDSKFIHINRQMEKEMTEAAFERVALAGHRVHIDNPDTVISILRKFTNREQSLK